MVTMPAQSPSFRRPSCIGARSSVKDERDDHQRRSARVLMKKMVCQP